MVRSQTLRSATVLPWKNWERIAKGKTAPLLIAPIKGAAVAAGLHSNSKSHEPLGELEKLVGLCGLAYQGRNDIDDIIPSSHRSSDLDGRKPNLVVSLLPAGYWPR